MMINMAKTNGTSSRMERSLRIAENVRLLNERKTAAPETRKSKGILHGLKNITRTSKNKDVSKFLIAKFQLVKTSAQCSNNKMEKAITRNQSKK